MSNVFSDCEWIEYPENKDLMEGPAEGIIYSYVSTTYLNGFINYVEIIDAYMTRRYKELRANNTEDELCWEDSCALIDKLLADSNYVHTDTSDCSEYDDIHILAKCGDYFYYFWSDCDCSDSCIGKVRASEFENEEDAKKQFKEFLYDTGVWDAYSNEFVKEFEEDFLKRIKPSFFRGWITL